MIHEPQFLDAKERQQIQFISPRLAELFAKDSDEQLNYLRQLYKQNLSLFFDIRDELLFRGYFFDESLTSKFALFPKFKATGKVVIRSNKGAVSCERFKEIPFAQLGVVNVIRKFGIVSDYMFENVPLDGFLHLNPQANLQDIQMQFMEHGFSFNGAKEEGVAIDLLRVTEAEFFYFQNNPLRTISTMIGMDYLAFIDSIYGGEQDLVNHIEYSKQLFIRKLDRYKHIEKIDALIEEIKNMPSYNMLKELPFYLIDGSKNEQTLSFMLEKQTLVLHEVQQLYESLTLYKSIGGFIEFFLKQLREKELTILTARANGLTLQDIGDQFDVSRERIRQIEAKTIKQFKKKINISQLDCWLGYILGENKFLQKQQLYKELNVLDPVEQLLLNEMIASSLQYLYDANLKCFMSIEIQRLMEEFLPSLYAVPIIMKKDLEVFCSKENILFEVVEHFLLANEFDRTEQVFFKTKNLTIPKKANFIFSVHYRKAPLLINEAGYNEFNKHMLYYFKEMYKTDNLHALIERVRTGENIILVGPSTFLYHDPNDFDGNSFIADMTDILNTYFSSHDTLTSSIIYEIYPKIVDKYGLSTHQHLYSLIQFYLGDDYSIGRGNTFEIRPLNSSDEETSMERFYKYLAANDNKVARSKVLKDLLWREYKLDQLIGRMADIIILKDKTIVHIDYFHFDHQDLQCIIKSVEKELENGYVIVGKLFAEMMFDDDLEELLTSHQVEDDYTLGQIVKKIMPHLQGYTNLLYPEDSLLNTIAKVIAHEFNGIVYRKDIEDFIENSKYSLSTRYVILCDLVSQDYFVPYSSTEFINSKELAFTDNVQQSVTQYLNSLVGENKYFTLKDAIGYTTEIKKVSTFEWTPYLLFAFAEQCGFRPLYNSKDMRFYKLFIIREDLPIYDFEDLIKYVLETEYEGEYVATQVIDFLYSKKLYRNNKGIPFELRDGKYYKIDDCGIIVRK